MPLSDAEAAALRDDLRALEARVMARIELNTQRLSNLEGWQHEMIGAGKIGRIVWVALFAVGAAAWQLILWIMGHPPTGGSSR